MAYRSTHRTDRSPSIWLRGFLVLLILVGLLGQLTIQSQARQGEMPRQTLERLTGLDIGFHPDDGQAMSACDDMPGMDMLGMTDAPSGSPDRHHHHDGGYCALCPLLHLASVILGPVIIVLLIVALLYQAAYVLPPSRAPPVLRLAGLPPPTGPPLGF